MTTSDIAPLMALEPKTKLSGKILKTTLAGALVDVGTVRVSANMTMPGMVMPGNVQVQPSGVPGRYAATAEFGMAGTWPISVEWNGPAGSGSANFQGSVQ